MSFMRRRLRSGVGGDGLLDGFHGLFGNLFGEIVQVGPGRLVNQIEAGFFGHEQVEQQTEDPVARECIHACSGLTVSS